MPENRSRFFTWIWLGGILKTTSKRDLTILVSHDTEIQSSTKLNELLSWLKITKYDQLLIMTSLNTIEAIREHYSLLVVEADTCIRYQDIPRAIDMKIQVNKLKWVLSSIVRSREITYMLNHLYQLSADLTKLIVPN